MKQGPSVFDQISTGIFRTRVLIYAVSLVPVLRRFLIKSENRALPLCFDVDIPGGTRLKLLHHPSEGQQGSF